MPDCIVRGVALQAAAPTEPKIIVPLMAQTPEQLLALLSHVGQADLLEIRLDALNPAYYVGALCEARRAVGQSMPLLATIRTVREGGNADLSPEAYEEACLALLESYAADLLDIEWSVGAKRAVRLRDACHAAGCKAVFSCHHFEGTPSTNEMAEVLVDMAQYGADAAKLAVMPHSAADAARLLEALALAKAECPDTPMLAMSMGAYGTVTRLCGGAFGSCAAFGAAGGRTSAPGQPDAAALRGVLDAMKKAMG